jgi:hypothetical protein
LCTLTEMHAQYLQSEHDQKRETGRAFHLLEKMI